VQKKKPIAVQPRGLADIAPRQAYDEALVRRNDRFLMPGGKPLDARNRPGARFGGPTPRLISLSGRRCDLVASSYPNALVESDLPVSRAVRGGLDSAVK